MNNPRLKLAAVAALAVLTLSTCRDAIFATIETEKKADTNTLGLTLIVSDIEATPAGSGAYTVAAGGIFQGTISPLIEGTISWNPNSDSTKRPFNPNGLFCNAMALFGTSLYGGFIDSSGNGSFYQSDSNYSFGAVSALTQFSAGAQVTLLKAAGGLLFRVVATPANPGPFSYELDYSSSGTTWAVAGGIGGTSRITGVGYDNLHGQAFWATEGSTVYKSTNIGAPAFAPSTVPGLGTDVTTGLFADSANGRVFVFSAKSGIFYTADGGVSWQAATDDSPSGGTSGQAAAFLSGGGPVNGPTGTIYILGSDGFGYYTIDVGQGPSSLSRFGDSTITLFAASVSSVLVDDAGGQQNVLLGTNGQGVWRAVFDGSGNLLSGTNEYWIHE